MNKDKERCFKLEKEILKLKEEMANNESKHIEEIEELQNKYMKIRNEKNKTDKDFNIVYNDNIKLRYAVEEKKSEHGYGLKKFSDIVKNLEF